MEDSKDNINLKYEPLGLGYKSLSDVDSVSGSEGANVIRLLQSELANDINIKYEPSDYALDNTDSISVTEFNPTVTNSNFIKTELKGNGEEEKIDLKFEFVDCRLKRPAIENVEMQFECHKCSYKSKDKSNVRRHIVAIHEKEKTVRYACELCSYQTNDTAHLGKHKRLHIRFSLKCIFCQKSFKYKKLIDSHYVSVHWDQSDSFKHLLTYKVNQCSKCSFVNASSSHFKDHLLTHEKDRSKFKFECHACGHKCKCKSTLKKHLRLHAEQLPFSCTVCNKGFIQKQQLDSHIVSQHKENEQLMKTVTSKIHQCLKCTFRTVQSSHFKKHIKNCN